MSNGIIVVKDSWIEHAHPAQVCGVSSRVLAPEEMVVSKLFVTRRERFDGADIAHIIFALKGKLDWNRILRLAGDHWELVLWNLILFRYVYPAQADYVPQDLWQELLGRVSKTVQSPEATPRFRGTLVDDAMFAIDVEEWGLDNLLAEQRSQTAKIEPRSQPQRTNSKLRAS
jgi:hypothetical protein